MIPIATLAIEAQMMNPPKPTNFAVKADGQVLAVLTYEEVKRAIERYEEMESEYSSKRPSRR